MCIHKYVPNINDQMQPFYLVAATHNYVEKRYYTPKRSFDCKKQPIFQAADDGFWDYRSIYFQVTQSGNYIAKKALIFVDSVANINIFVNDIFSEFEKFAENSGFIFFNYISCILTEMITLCFQKKKITYVNQDLLERSARFFLKNYDKVISINQLAQQEYISVYYFIKIFLSNY